MGFGVEIFMRPKEIMKKLLKHRIIKWHDASGLRNSDEPSEWFTLERAIERAKETWESICETSGWIIYEDKKILVIATTKTEDIYSDITMIPKSLIL